MKLTIGVMVAPRKIETVDRTLQSLSLAGFSDDLTYCFFEPGEYSCQWKNQVKRPDCFFSTSYPLIPSPEGKFGNFQNFVQTLRDLVAIDPSSDAVMIVEDDAIFAQNVRVLVADEIDTGFQGGLSLYTPNIRQFFEIEKKGFQKITREYFFGGLALVISMEIAIAILNSDDILGWSGGRRQSPGIHPWEREASDAWVGKAVRKIGKEWWGWNPSLVGHYCPSSCQNGNSARGLGGPHTGARQAKRFIGEETDAVEYFRL